MKNDLFAIIVASVGISITGAAVSQNLVDPVSDLTDLKIYSPYAGRTVADTNYYTDNIRVAVDRDPYLATTSAAYQTQYGVTSSQTRQLDYQHRRSGWRLVGVEPEPITPSGEIVGLQPVPDGLPYGSVEVVGAELARFRVNPGVRLYRAPSGKYYYVEDPTAPGSTGADLVFGQAPEGSRVVDAASVGVTQVPAGFVVVRGPDDRLYLAPKGMYQ
ncbi:MAG: hypothetical protein ACPG42_09105 [Alphaproteobacteria bacterium]